MDRPHDMMKAVTGKALQMRADTDYKGAEDLLMCAKCNTKKQIYVMSPAFAGEPRRQIQVPVLCECEQRRLEEERQADEKREFQRRMEMLQRDGITDPAYLRYTFAQDDQRNPDISRVCQKYAENWQEMRQDNIGILFYGGVGTGKSFLACAIANALLAKLVPVSVTNFPRILNQLQSFGNERQAFIDKLQRYRLLVIDDLGVERDTSYSAEQVFNVVDARVRSGMPLIVTTNLSMDDLKNPPSLAHARIYDRVLEMCPIRLKLVGDSRRAGNASDRKERARKILGLG